MEAKSAVKPLDIAILRLPHVSNFTDFIPLEQHPLLGVRYVSNAHELGAPDLILLPGTKNTVDDLLWLRQCGLEAALLRLAGKGTPVLGVCGGYQMLGSYYETYDGQRCDFIGALDLYTVGSKTRMIGNYKFKCGEAAGGSVVVGFENHSGKTHLGRGMEPLGTVLAGFGNNGEDGTEGAHYKNVFGTYSHGPMLPKNPEFCDMLLATALEHRYGKAELAPLDDTLELLAHDEMCARVN